MIVPQTMFNVLARHFEGITPCLADGTHGPASAANVRWLQKAARLPLEGLYRLLGPGAEDAVRHRMGQYQGRPLELGQVDGRSGQRGVMV